MPSPITWADLRGRRVGLWGLGTEGRANLAKLRSLGVEPVIVDDRPAGITDEQVLATDEGGLEALAGTDVVVKSPGIPRHAAAGLDVVVTGGLALWLHGVDRSRVVCVTGTKGKSTTTAVAAHLARRLGVDAVVGGNIGDPPWAVGVPDDAELWVIEVSSYQAADVALSPPVVAVTSLDADHLPWHGGFEQYVRDKLSICSRPGAELTVASGDSEQLRRHASLLGPRVQWVDETSFPGAWDRPLGLVGAHNRTNAAIARACLVAVGVAGADDDEAVERAAAGFVPLESRLTSVANVGGVEFVDDSLSTNVLPTVAALDAFADRRVALICGGADRDLDYVPLAEALAARDEPALALTAYTTGPRIAAAIRAVGAPGVEVRECDDLADAVTAGWQWARPDGVVLLSPAAASFDAFDDYRHRARAFREAITRLPSR